MQVLLTPGAMLQIVAGLESEQTNTFLQMLAKAAAQTVQVTQATSLKQKVSQSYCAASMDRQFQ